MIIKRSISLLFHRLNICTQITTQRHVSSLCGKYRATCLPKVWNQATSSQSSIGSQKLIPILNGYSLSRHFSTDKPSNSPPNDEEQNNKDDSGLSVPLLMDFIPHGMPNLWYSLKNYYIINFLLRGQIDKGFDIRQFIEGAKQALVTVSSNLANNQLDNLEGLVDKNALEEIKTNYKKLSMAQRKELELIKSDIVLTFAHNVRIDSMKEDFTGTKKHIVHIFIVFDCVRNLEAILKEKAAKRERGNARELFKEFNDRKIICNYEFKREYIDGSPPSEWMITKLIHIKESDLVNIIYRG